MYDIPKTLSLPAHVTQHCFPMRVPMIAALAQHVARAMAAGVSLHQHASLLVSGGRSPIPFFEALATQSLPWALTAVGLVDERWVPADSEDSNEGLVRRHLLRGPASEARFIPLKGVEATPEAGLAAAQFRVREFPRPFDLVILGMGTDGHTASWFPGAPGTDVALAGFPGLDLACVRPETAPHPRITMNLRAVLDARQIVIAIEGKEKRNVIERAAQAGVRPQDYPIAAVLDQDQAPVHVFYCD